MGTSQQRVSIATLIVLTTASAARAEKQPLDAELRRCPPVVFIKRPAQGRKRTNGTGRLL